MQFLIRFVLLKVLVHPVNSKYYFFELIPHERAVIPPPQNSAKAKKLGGRSTAACARLVRAGKMLATQVLPYDVALLT